MGTGYTRNDTSNNIADGNVIDAADLDGEFDAIQAAFNASTGHTHDGTSAEGAPITVTGPAQEYVSTGTEFRTKTNNTYDLGSSGVQWKNAYIAGNITVGGTVDGRDVAADGSKLDGIEAGATGDQTAAEIRALVEAATDSNVFTDADHSKLNGIEAGATADQTAGEILTAIKTVDGAASGLDADLLDGQQGTYYLDANNFTNMPAGYTGWTVSDGTNSESVTDGSSVIFSGSGATSVSYNTSTNTLTISSTDNNTTYSAGSGITLSGTTFSHTDTSSQASVNNSGVTYIQDVTLDTYGHVTGLASGTVTLAGLGYTGATNADNYGSWSAQDGDGGSYTITSGDTLVFAEGTGIDVNFTADDVLTITNTAPDQTVSLTGSGATSISGTYPNFTISSTDTNTTYSAGNGISLSGTTFSLSTSFTVSGDITAANFIVSSDQRLKENVVPIESGLDKVKALQGVEFDWISNGKHQIGFIAQEVEKVIPDVVSTGEDGIKGVQYANLVAVLVEAVKELSNRIDELEGNK
jgi:hypothetical protein